MKRKQENPEILHWVKSRQALSFKAYICKTNLLVRIEMYKNTWYKDNWNQNNSPRFSQLITSGDIFELPLLCLWLGLIFLVPAVTTSGLFLPPRLITLQTWLVLVAPNIARMEMVQNCGQVIDNDQLASRHLGIATVIIPTLVHSGDLIWGEPYRIFAGSINNGIAHLAFLALI